MKIRTVAAAAAIAFGAFMPASGSASQPQDTVARVLDGVDPTFAEQGYKPAGWTKRGRAKAGGAAAFALPLQSGRSVALITACDDDCADVDAILLDPAGKLVDQDVLDDDSPIVTATASQSGTYTVVVAMKVCKSECSFGVKAFTK